MKRTNLNFSIDVSAFVGFILLTTTGVLMRYILPPGSGSHSTIWGLDRHHWGDIHFWISVIFFSILAFHLILHWRWIASVVTGQHNESSGLRAGLGIVGLITVITLSVSPLLSPTENRSNQEGSSFSRHSLNDVIIDGSMTLKEIEQSTGVPASYIIDSLGLPEAVSAKEKLGSLKRKQSFEISNVREAVKAYKIRMN